MPTAAEAGWIITPFIGLKFAGKTNFVDLEKGAGETKVTLGGSVGLLSDGVFGLEADFGYSPRFFQGAGSTGLVTRSNVTTFMGNVIVAAPLRVTRESLRPYAVGGLGLMHAGIDDVLHVFKVNSNLLGLVVGGGAIGPLTNTASLRFDLRYFKNLSKADGPLLGFGATQLSFWRATAGVTLRY